MKLRKLLPLATLATVAGGATLSSLASCSCGPTVTTYEFKDESDSNIKIESAKTFRLNEPLIINYSFTTAGFDLDKVNSEIKIGKKNFKLNELAVDETQKIITVTSEKIISSDVTVQLKTIQSQQELTLTWTIDHENPTVQPESWQTQLPAKRGEGQVYSDWIATEEYLTDASNNKAILAGDIACSYYSEAFGAYTNNQYLQSITTTIKDINPEAWSTSFTVVETPIEGAEYEQYALQYDVENLQYVVADISLTVSGKTVNGWAIEPLVLWLADTQHIANAIKYLQIDKDWSVTLTDVTGSITYDYETEEGSRGTDDPNTLWYFIEKGIWGLGLSFKTNYWAYSPY